jgi:hypothetical protein
LTFTIRTSNTGTAPAVNVTLTDNLTAYNYLNIANLTTTKGTTNIDGRVATVTIGTLMPNEVVTVTLTVRVTASPTTTQNPCNRATITFGTTGSVMTNLACFTVLGGGTLPGTGERVDFAQAEENSSSVWWAAGYGLLTTVLFFAAYISLRQKKNKQLFFFSGLLLVAAASGLVFFIQNEDSREPGHQISAEIDVGSAPLQKF